MLLKELTQMGNLFTNIRIPMNLYGIASFELIKILIPVRMEFQILPPFISVFI